MVNVKVAARWQQLAAKQSRVTVAGYGAGTLVYYGKTKKSPFEKRCGVALDAPRGKHDGTVGETTYFACRPKHGIIIPLAKVRVRVPYLLRLTPARTRTLAHPSCLTCWSAIWMMVISWGVGAVL